MVEIVWSEPALADLEAIADYIALQNPVAASQLVQMVMAHVGHFAEHPERSQRIPELGKSRYRQLVEPHYRVFYRYDGERVMVVHIMRSERLLRKGKLRKKP